MQRILGAKKWKDLRKASENRFRQWKECGGGDWKEKEPTLVDLKSVLNKNMWSSLTTKKGNFNHKGKL